MTAPLTQSEFAAMFEGASHTLWCIAIAVLADRTHAEDAVQEAALIGLRKLDDFEPGSSFGAWMGQIVRNVARNLARRRRRGPALSDDLDRLDSGRMGTPELRRAGPITDSGALRSDQESFDDSVLAALNSLNETARACLLLRTIMNTPYDEISRILDIPPGTAMSHVHRSRHELRSRLDPGPAPDSTPAPDCSRKDT